MYGTTMSSDEELVQARVDDGVRLLDITHPRWWRNRRRTLVDRLRRRPRSIDLGELVMHSEHLCVLGQMFGSFGRGHARLGFDRRSRHGSVEHGFDAHLASSSGAMREYAALGLAWRKVIEDRRAYERRGI